MKKLMSVLAALTAVACARGVDEELPTAETTVTEPNEPGIAILPVEPVAADEGDPADAFTAMGLVCGDTKLTGEFWFGLATPVGRDPCADAAPELDEQLVSGHAVLSRVSRDRVEAVTDDGMRAVFEIDRLHCRLRREAVRARGGVIVSTTTTLTWKPVGFAVDHRIGVRSPLGGPIVSCETVLGTSARRL